MENTRKQFQLFESKDLLMKTNRLPAIWCCLSASLSTHRVAKNKTQKWNELLPVAMLFTLLDAEVNRPNWWLIDFKNMFSRWNVWRCDAFHIHVHINDGNSGKPVNKFMKINSFWSPSSTTREFISCWCHSKTKTLHKQHILRRLWAWLERKSNQKNLKLD